jgi:hypothetical protein
MILEQDGNVQIIYYDKGESLSQNCLKKENKQNTSMVS